MFSKTPPLLADLRAGMCAHCYRDAFETLAKPCNSSPHMRRSMEVATYCRRCYESSFLQVAQTNYRRAKTIVGGSIHALSVVDDVEIEWFFPTELYHSVVTKEVYMPTEVLSAAASLVNKAASTAKFGAKPPNDWLQIANLVTQGKHQEDYAFALSTVGAAAIVDEVRCSMPRMTLWDCCVGISERTGRSKPGYAWERFRDHNNVKALENGGGSCSSSLEDGPVKGMPQPPFELPPGLEKDVTTSTEIDEQMGAYVNGAVLESETVIVERGDHVQDTRTTPEEIGQRVARARFPKTSEVKEYLFSNDPNNLVAAQAMRDKDVGSDQLSPHQVIAFDEAVVALKKHLFTKTRIRKAERFVEKTTDVLPKNRSAEAKMKMHIDALNATGDETVPFSILVDAFTKKEVTSKQKPRPIVNHGDARVWGMAKCAAVFEDVMFHALPHACIKHAEKHEKMNELFSNLDGFPYQIENDLTSFEFGIHERLKQAECNILKHIMSHLNLDSDNTGFCHRVVNARTKCCTWVLRYVDAAGAKCQLKIDMPRAMRESGDRITSSGNFLQNLLAWVTLMVKPGKVESAIQSLIHNKGKFFFYCSARDGRQYKAYLAFEGDDTLGALQEKILVHNDGQLIDEFFTDHGWKAKLKVAKNKGDASINFVGYTALLRDGAIVRDGANVVMFPEIKRIIRDKPWSSSDIPEDEFHATVAVYATCMANEFKRFAPMHAFFSAMRQDHLAYGGEIRKMNGMLRDLYVKMHGEVGTEAEVLSHVPDPEPFLDGGKDYQDLARVHAGEITAEEYASVCGLTTLEVHGRDLACLLPRAWVV